MTEYTGYLDGYLKKNLDQAKRVIKKDWDMVFCVDGYEGCLTGDTTIRITRNKLGRKYRLDYLYKQFHDRSNIKNGDRWNLSNPSRIRSLMNNHINLHPIKDVVYSGKKQVWELTLENGYNLKATKDHRIMTDYGWVELQNLKDHKVMCDTPQSRKSGKKPINRNKDFVISGAYFHPYLNTRRLLEIHRATYEADLNTLSLGEYLKIIFNDELAAKQLKYIDPSIFHIHHKDGDHYNNTPSNLECVDKTEHWRQHGYDNYVNFNQGVPEFVGIESITYVGVEDTYDIECEEPYHNFVANGIIVHNSGKSVLAQQVAKYCDPTLDISRIAFTPTEFIDTINSAKKYQAVIYDEAYGGMSSRAAMSEVNRSLMSVLAEIRQKNLFVFVVMPCFFEMDKYAAVWRSRALLHVYTGDDFKRGFFSFYSQDRKKSLYVLGKKFYSYRKPPCNFHGRFTKGYVVDEEDYRAKKNATLRARSEPEEQETSGYRKALDQRNDAWKLLKDETKQNSTILGKKLGVSSSTFRGGLNEVYNRGKSLRD